MTKYTMIVAVANNGVIGYKGKIPWHIPEDLVRFKRLTNGKPLVMGRSTFESLPGILPGRDHHVISSKIPDVIPDNVFFWKTIEEVIVANKDQEEVFVIGGTNIYSAFEGIANKIEVTEVHCNPAGDTFFEPLKLHWVQEKREVPDFPDYKGNAPISFVTLKRGNNFEVSIT